MSVSSMPPDPRDVREHVTLVDRLHAAFSAITTNRPETVDALGELYADDVHFEDPIQSLDGREAFLAMNRRLLARSRDLSFCVVRTLGDDADFAITWTMHFAPKIGPRVSVDGVTHARSRDGRVVYHRDYWDLAALFASGIPGGQRALRLALKPFA